jgi:hypothetical protein
VGAVVGGAAFGVAKLAHRRSRPKLLGLRIPDDLNPQRIDAAKLAAHGKDLVRHIGDLAEQVEARSEDVRSLSGQAKRLSRRIS